MRTNYTVTDETEEKCMPPGDSCYMGTGKKKKTIRFHGWKLKFSMCTVQTADKKATLQQRNRLSLSVNGISGSIGIRVSVEENLLRVSGACAISIDIII